MKRHLGIKTILLKVTPATLPGLRSLAEQFLRGKQILADPGLTVYQLPDGTVIELYGPGASYPPYLFSHGDVVIGYRVHDLEQAVAALLQRGATLLSDVVHICAQNCYCFVLLDDAQVIGLYQLTAAMA